jgi:putative ribosome biogenesis GTPase RsgA
MLIKLSHNEMKNRKIDNTMTSKYISNINIILINIVITLGISGVGKTSLIQR